MFRGPYARSALHTVRIFIGYDPNETVAYHVLCHSLLETATYPVSITPIRLTHVSRWFSRERLPMQSTEFSFSRFLVPFLCNYEGWAIFMDCDFLCFEDIYKLWQTKDEKYDLMCVQHDHHPKERTKFLGALQTQYEKKNWSSLMMFNNERCRNLTRFYVNRASGLSLHQFEWCEGEIGNIDKKWNHLVNYTDYDPAPFMVHYTEGGPYFKEYEGCQYSNEWFATKQRMEYASQTSISATG